jgi:Zn-dependent peptidase ImmA (M78 family)/transcriptional regulator with XRE-family HTH domain
MIYGKRIRQARESYGLTQKELSERVGVAQSFIAQLEASKILPTRQMLEALAKETDVLPAFFEDAPTPVALVPGSPAFRARKSAKAIERDRVLAYSVLQIEQLCRMTARLNLPPFENVRVAEDPVGAARETRAFLGLDPLQPISNLINTIERKGFIVIAMPFEMERVDAVCMWAMIDIERPIIVLSDGKTGDRLRFSVAHELGHVVLHKELMGDYTNMESEANQFAGELLLPEQSMRERMTPALNLTQAAHLKLEWGVSIQALVKRAADLGIITKRKYHYLFQQLTSLGWRTREPPNLDIPVEKPRTFKKMVEMYYGHPQDAERLASSMHFTRRHALRLLSTYSLGVSRLTLEGTEEYTYPEGQQNLN